MTTKSYGLERILSQERDRSLFRKITDFYFKPKSFEKGGKIYRYLGVHYFQKALMATVGKPLRKMGADRYAGTYFIGKRPNLESFKTYEAGTRLNEMIHAPQVLWNATFLASNIAQGHCVSAAIFGFFLLLNAYCAMLQRYNRARVYNVIEKREAQGFYESYSGGGSK